MCQFNLKTVHSTGAEVPRRDFSLRTGWKAAATEDTVQLGDITEYSTDKSAWKDTAMDFSGDHVHNPFADWRQSGRL